MAMLPGKATAAAKVAHHVRGEAASPLALAQDEQVLVTRVRGGDAEAFEAVFRAHYDALCAFAEWYVPSRADAEEAVQGIFVRLWERRAGWYIRESVRGYLCRAVRNHVFHDRRRARIREQIARDVATDRTDVPGLGRGGFATADAQLYTDSLEKALRGAIGQLPARCREVLLLRWEQHLSYADIATTVGVAVKTVENQLAQAHRVLRKVLAPYR